MGVVAVTHVRIGPMPVAVGALEEITSEGLRLGAHFARPPGLARVPGLLILPGFPRGPGGAAAVGNTYAGLVDRIAREAGWGALTFTMRGTGTSEGDFSIEGWLADVRAAIDALHARTDITGVWLSGFRLGGTLAVVAAAHDNRVRGLATFSAPASLRTWVEDPVWFLEYARRTGVLRNPDYPPDPGALDPRHREPRHHRRGRVHRAPSVAARPRLRRRRRSGRPCASAARSRGRLRRAPHRPERAPPTAARSACDRRAARLAGPAGVDPRAYVSRARALQDVAQRVGQGVLGFPAGGRAQFGGVAHEARRLDGTNERGILHEAQRALRMCEQELGDLRNRDAGTGADVVDLARRAVDREEAVRADDVADVVDVAHRVEVADGDLVAFVALGLDDALRERGDEEVGELSRTRVVEGPDADRLEPGAEPRLQREVRRGDLARAVGRVRPQGRRFGERQVGLGNEAVLLGAADRDDTRDAGLARRVENVQGAFDVDAQDAVRAGATTHRPA